MNRRGLLKMFGLLPLAPAALASPSDFPVTMDTIQHGPWIIKWSDWVRPSNMRVLIGHWVAIRPDSSLGAYSSIPGGCGWYYPMQMFDVSVHEKDGQVLITPETSLKIAERQRSMALDRLIKFLKVSNYSSIYHL